MPSNQPSLSSKEQALFDLCEIKGIPIKKQDGLYFIGITKDADLYNNRMYRVTADLDGLAERITTWKDERNGKS